MLSRDEKELLAVVKYYTGHRKAIARLLTKLQAANDDETVKAITGLTSVEIHALLLSTSELKPSRLTQKTVAVNAAEPIELGSKSTVAVRVAYDMAQAIAQEFKPGDAIWGQKEAMVEFQCVSRTVSQAFKILREKGWIEYANPKNHRFGNIVK